MLLVLNKRLMEWRELISEHSKVTKRSANTADKVKDNEPLRPPEIFQYTAEHPEREHIEKYMGHAAMHEHMCNYLPPPEFRRFPVMERKYVFKRNSVAL